MGWDEFDTEQHETAQAACFEFALAVDPASPFPADAALTLTGPEEETQTVRLADGVQAGGFVSCRFAAPVPGAEYSLSYAGGGKSSVFFDGAELHGFVDDATGLTETVITTRVVDTTGKTLAIDAAALEAAGQTLPLAATTTQGDWWRDVTEQAAGDLTLVVDSDGETRVDLTLGEADGAPAVSFRGGRPAGASLIRVRGGEPGDWSAVYFLITLIKPARYALYVPCSYDFKAGDGSYFLQVAEALEKTYAAKGYAGGTICATYSWDDVIKAFDEAVSAGKQFNLLVTIGHGGWDGPILEWQFSRFSEPERFEKLLAAAKKALAPGAKAFFSNCHTGGSNKYEWANDKKLQKSDQAALDKAQADLDEAKANLAANAGADATTLEALGRTVADAELAVEEAQETLSYNDLYFSRWVEDFAKGAGCVAAGPMGGTSTTYTEQHVKAVFERDGTVKQEVYVADPIAKQVHVIPALKGWSAAKTSPMEDPPTLTPQSQAGATSPLPAGLPSHVLLPSELGL